ncbi:c-type cytochrome [Roseomonas sp. SSH11]|uniref:C-type cytochrome n=1 Tax=Pararoseomonas baculiformis TaxID=2820812 RepID=A0ABS4AJU3_9PROT|nr:c-type cytochrome [Pararoseomonas baculiformis]MBP0446484.1 c-type cytochrome [Pararoseomonas baculiformis]
MRTLTMGLALIAPAFLFSGVARAQDTAVARGQAVAAERNCGACHGERGVSATPTIPSLAGQQGEFVTLQLVLFREGLRDVPAMQAPAEGLTDQQVEDLGAYFASLPHSPPPDRARRNVGAYNNGAALANRLRCGVCHLPNLVGQNQVPHIAGQREEFLAGTLKAYRDGTRHGTDTQMNAAVYGLSDAQIDAIAHYVSQR